MSRGTKRPSGATSSGRGAAGPSGSSPLARKGEPAAPTAETSRRRPGRRGENPLAGQVAAPAAQRELVTTDAITTRLEDTANRARFHASKATGARDAASALSVEARCVNKLYDIAIGSKLEAEIADLKAQIGAMTAHLAGKKGSAQRADVAPAPRLARRPGPVQ